MPEHAPTVLSVETQDVVLDAIAESDRGLFLALARMGLRPGEAVALDAADYTEGWITVARARKGKRLADPIRATKTGRPKRLPVPDALAAWIAAHVPQTARLERRPLFVNPRTRGRWTATSMSRVWKRACKKVGVEAGLYEGTKHSFATDANLRGVPERALQAYLGHRDVRSTRRYARLADQALVEVLRRPLEAARRLQGDSRRKNSRFDEDLVVEAPRIEPESKPRKR